ncbi:selenouridine synthase SelU-like subunit [Methanococcus voltae PS]|uniref:Selenouridine synthase SelU-like subunit n=1 Tax=Methanococcus voltae PS TaxID=523842 RepID=A0ABT2EVY8_METVO|nr:selenouridine synthase SelU-like subunit [Methanococcus voltae]MCS3922107.1 selenouridine synthase SelU-like subunit [Methanococcus voltae PS]
MIIIGLFGKTGCGKTEILELLKENNYSVVDIEGCANTKGSVLGDLYHLKQNDQETFDRLLNEQHEKALEKGYCIVEFEGRYIGGQDKVKIPEPYSDLKNYSNNILIDCPYDCQMKRLLKWYEPQNKEEKEVLIGKINLLQSFFKHKMVDVLKDIEELIKNDEYYKASEMIEENLYADHYLRHIKKVDCALEINNIDSKDSFKEVEKFVNLVLKENNLKI